MVAFLSAGEVRVFAPATVANLGLGFDILGLALREPGDTVVARLVSGQKIVTLKEVRGDGGQLSKEAASNTAGIAAIEVLKKAGIEAGIELTLDKGLPIGSGMGSSAASAAAAALAVNLLLGSPLRKADLIGPCIEAEAAVSGRHADNVAPAMLGGLILVRALEPLDLLRLPVPDGLTIAVVSPRFELSTRKARSVLPEAVPLTALVRNTANIAALVSAFHSGDLTVIARCVPDEVVTPVRAALIPGCMEVIRAALDAGALGSSISGSGPSVFALCRSAVSAQKAAAAMVQAFERAGLAARAVVSPADSPGARRI